MFELIFLSAVLLTISAIFLAKANRTRRPRDFSRKFFDNVSLKRQVNDAIVKQYGFTSPELTEIVYFAKSKGYGVSPAAETPIANEKIKKELENN